MARKSKHEVKYTLEAMDPSEQCKLCAHFYVVGMYDAGRCTRVDGWCELFKALK
jgi:hypothetical protein